MTPELLQNLVLVLVPLILSLAVHEWAHAATARALGDDTAQRQGRLTLNPISHIDPIGTLLIPGLLVLSGSGLFFGWAKPVPFNPTNFSRKIRMKHGVLLTAIAGPVSNLVLALIAAVLFAFASGNEAAQHLLVIMVTLNVTLFLFNMLPVPPLDGSKVAYGLLPDRANAMLRFFESRPWVVPVAFILVFWYGGRLLGPPMMAISHSLLSLFN